MEQKEKNKKGKIIQILVGSITFIIAYFAVQQFFKKDIEIELRNAASELNKQTPMQIDQFSKLDSVSNRGKTNFIYYFTLIDLEKSEVNLDTVNKYIKPNIIENIKANHIACI